MKANGKAAGCLRTQAAKIEETRVHSTHNYSQNKARRRDLCHVGVFIAALLARLAREVKQ